MNLIFLLMNLDSWYLLTFDEALGLGSMLIVLSELQSVRGGLHIIW